MKCETLILGKIITLATDALYAQAMACKEGRIVYVGSKEVAERLCDEKTKVYDYGDNVVYPGFWDSHTHGEMAGHRMGFQADLQFAKSMPEFVRIMKEYVEANPEREYYLGSGWDKYEEPTAAMLDAICPDKPMVLRSVCGHMVWVNTAAMRAVGYDAAKAKAMGPAMVHVDEDGNPTGFMAEAPVNDFVRAFPPTKEELKEGLLLWQDFAFKHGMTAVVEAYADMYEGAIEAYAELAEEGKLKLRTYAYPVNVKMLPQGVEAMAGYFEEMTRKYHDEYFTVKGFKLFMDGVVDAHTADLLDAYADMPDHYGMSQIAGREDLIRGVVKAVNAKGIPVHVHAIGDAAVRKVVDIFEESELECCNFDVRNMISHLALVHPDDIRRIADYHIIPVVAPLWVNKAPVFFEHEVEKLGEDRAYRSFPIKSFEEAGATICFHTDYPITPRVDKPVEIYQAIRRGTPGEGPKSVRNADEGISPLRCLLALTANAAYAVGQEDNLGTLTMGKIANAVVYDRDFLTCDVEDIPNARLIATIIDGEAVYTAQEYREFEIEMRCGGKQK